MLPFPSQAVAMNRAFLPLIFSGLLVGCGSGSEEDPVPDTPPDGGVESEVSDVLNEYYDALSARDWGRFEDFFWPGATLTTVWTPPGETDPRVVFTGVPEFVAQAPEGPGSREIFEERLLSAEVTVESGLAQAWVRYHARFGDPGDLLEWEGVDAFTLMRHHGRWRITALAYVPDEE
jgi:hypothetical protein